MIISSAVSGAITEPDSQRAREHAARYYEAIRKRQDDVSKIAANTSYTEEEIAAIKKFIFMEKHDLGDGDFDYFAPDFRMAGSWQRLIDGRDIQPHDLILLEHEKMERELMEQGIPQNKAHDITSKTYNFKKEADLYYGKIKKYKNM